MLECSNLIMDVHQDAIVLISSPGLRDYGNELNYCWAQHTVQVRGRYDHHQYLSTSCPGHEMVGSICPGRSKKDKLLLATA
jgi:hypothetical protein